METYDREMNVAPIIADLEAAQEKLNDLMFEVLREASAAGSGRPAADKELLKAQRAVEKALHHLRNPQVMGD